MLNTFHKTVFERSFARLWARWQYILTTFDGERGRKPFCGGPCTRSSHLKAAPHPPARTEASTMSGAVRTPPSLAERSEEDKCRRLGRAREHAGSLNIGGGQGYTKVHMGTLGTQGYTGVHRGTQGYSIHTGVRTQGCTGVHRGTVHMDTQDYTGLHRGTQGYTGVRFGKQGCTGVHRGTQGYTEVHRGSLR